MSGIGIITNPHSKLNKRNPGRSALLGYILGEQGRLEVTSSLADLSRVARDFCDKGIDILAINGGDGTICRTLTAFIQEYGPKPLPRVVLLKGGTINVLANNLGVKGTPEQILYRLVENHSRMAPMPTVKVTTLKCEGSYGFLFGTGTAASFLKEYYKRKSGPLGALMWCIFVWMSRFWNGALYNRVMRDYIVRIIPKAQASLTLRTCAVFCSTVVKMPLGLPLFREVRGKLGRFQCVSFTFPAKDAVWHLPYTLVRMQKGSSKGKMSFCTDGMTLEADEPFDYTLDGELYTADTKRLTLEIGPDIEFVTI